MAIERAFSPGISPQTSVTQPVGLGWDSAFGALKRAQFAHDLGSLLYAIAIVRFHAITL